MTRQSRWILLWCCLVVHAGPGAAAEPPSSRPGLKVEVVGTHPQLGVATSRQLVPAIDLVSSLAAVAVMKKQMLDAEARDAPLRDRLRDYPFNQNIVAALRSKLAAPGTGSGPVIELLDTPAQVEAAEQASRDTMQVMVLAPSYTLDVYSDVLTVTLQANVVERRFKGSKVKATPVVARAYDYAFTLPADGRREGVDDWLAFDAAALGAILDIGIAQVTDMLVYDFSAAGRAAWTVPHGKGPDAGTVEERARNWTRSGDAQKQALHGSLPLTIGVSPGPANVPGSG